METVNNKHPTLSCFADKFQIEILRYAKDGSSAVQLDGRIVKRKES